MPVRPGLTIPELVEPVPQCLVHRTDGAST